MGAKGAPGRSRGRLSAFLLPSLPVVRPVRFPPVSNVKDSFSDSDLQVLPVFTGSTGPTTCSYSYYLLLIHVIGIRFGTSIRGKCIRFGTSIRGKCIRFGTCQTPQSTVKCGKLRGRGPSVAVCGSETDGLRGSDLVSLPRVVTVSEGATGTAGTGRTAQRVEAQAPLPASRSRGRATRS